MGLFSKSQPADDPIPERGGKYVLRQAISLRVRKKENLHILVQTIGVPRDYQEFRVWPERLNLFMPLPG